MSQRHAVQDATGVLATDEVGDILILVGQTADKPANGASGYAAGALFIDTQADKLYVNQSGSTWTVAGSHS